MFLPVRLQAVAEQVTPGSVAVDVGADHALLTIHLLASGRCPRVIAVEKAAGPLARAGLALAGVEGVDLRRGDGLEPLAPGEADVAVMAGIGGTTIAAILARAPRKVPRLVLQPMTGAARLRGWLAGHGFRVTGEDLVADGGKLYPVLVAEPEGPGDGRTSYPPLDGFRRAVGGVLPRNLLLEIGPLLLAIRHPLLPDHLESMAVRRERMGEAAVTGPRRRRAVAVARREAALLRDLLRRWPA